MATVEEAKAQIKRYIELGTPIVVYPDSHFIITGYGYYLYDPATNDNNYMYDFLESEGFINVNCICEDCDLENISLIPKSLSCCETCSISDIKNENGVLYIKVEMLRVNYFATIDLINRDLDYWREFNYDLDKKALKDFLKLYNSKIQLVPDEIKLLLEANI